MKDIENKPEQPDEVEAEWMEEPESVEIEEPTNVLVHPDDVCVLIRPNGETTHYVPGDDQNLTIGHAVGMTSTMEVFSGALKLLLVAGAKRMEAEEEGN